MTGERSLKILAHTEKGKEPAQILKSQFPFLGQPPGVQGGSRDATCLTDLR